MAPFSSGSVGYVISLASISTTIDQIDERSLGTTEQTSINSVLSASQQHVLIVLALLFASISVASSAIVFYWFVKMRRSFRHDLIMLLIQSDMFKAFWYMSYPLVFMINGHVPDESTFCQISGFFLTVSIEQSDVAVLIIAVHSALFIFKDQSFGKEEGLYPYRHLAYSFWLLSPLFMASLAFLESAHPYVVEDTYCYLRSRPFWYQLVLGWIPRYLIFIIILGTYGSIYCYVRNKFHNFSRDEIGSLGPSHSPHFYHSSPTLPLASHVLIPDFSEITRSENENGSNPHEIQSRRSGSKATRVMMAASFKREPCANSIPTYPTRCPLEGNPCSFMQRPSFSSSHPGNLQILPSPHPGPLPIPPALHTSAFKNNLTKPEILAQAPLNPWLTLLVRHTYVSMPGRSQQPSRVGIINLVPNYLNFSRTRKSKTPIQKQIPADQTVTRAELIATRDRIRRQLRFLFIYPMIYIGMWILPFIIHTMRFEPRRLSHPPFSVTCVTTVTICIQAFVDCWLFSTREKPWRHIPGNDGSFWGSFKFWTGWTSFGGLSFFKAGPGKTRDEMVREARDAYQRRDDELAQRRNNLDGLGNNSDYTNSQRSNSERSWWDFDRAASGLEVMNSVEEEVHVNDPIEEEINVSNPVEEGVHTSNPVEVELHVNDSVKRYDN